MYSSAAGQVQTASTTRRPPAWKPAEATIKPTRKDSCESKASRVASSDGYGHERTESDAMYIVENPVLQRELLTNLRMPRAFVLLFVYIALLGFVVYLAWPQEQRLDMAQPVAAKRLVNLF